MRFQVRFEPSGRELRVPAGSRLLDAVRQAGLPLARACGAVGLCGRCGLELLAGSETLPPAEPDERRARARNRVPETLRLACRVPVEGDLVVRAPYW